MKKTYYAMFDENKKEVYTKMCLDENVYIFENFENETREISEFCGDMEDNTLLDIKSKSNTLYVRYLNQFAKNDGFVAEISFTYGKLM